MQYIISTGEELYHHGVQGQKWGKRNGPPYPLSPAISTGSKLKNTGEGRLPGNREKAANKIKKSITRVNKYNLRAAKAQHKAQKLYLKAQKKGDMSNFDVARSDRLLDKTLKNQKKAHATAAKAQKMVYEYLKKYGDQAASDLNSAKAAKVQSKINKVQAKLAKTQMKIYKNKPVESLTPKPGETYNQVIKRKRLENKTSKVTDKVKKLGDGKGNISQDELNRRNINQAVRNDEINRVNRLNTQTGGIKDNVTKLQNPDGSLTKSGEKKMKKLIDTRDQQAKASEESRKATDREYQYMKKAGYTGKDQSEYRYNKGELYKKDEKFRSIADEADSKRKESESLTKKYTNELNKVSSSRYNALTVVGRDRTKQILEDYDEYRKRNS